MKYQPLSMAAHTHARTHAQFLGGAVKKQSDSGHKSASACDLHVSFRVQSASLLLVILLEKNNPPAWACACVCACVLHMCILSHLQDTWFITDEPRGRGPCQALLSWKQSLETADLLSVSSSNVGTWTQPPLCRSLSLLHPRRFLDSQHENPFVHCVFIYANTITLKFQTLPTAPTAPEPQTQYGFRHLSVQFSFTYAASFATKPLSGSLIEAHLCVSDLICHGLACRMWSSVCSDSSRSHLLWSSSVWLEFQLSPSWVRAAGGRVPPVWDSAALTLQSEPLRSIKASLLDEPGSKL